MSQERKFARNLIAPGSAAKVRETVSVAVREGSSLSKAQLVEPIDYESVTVKNKTVLQNDPQRELLLFPHDDVSISSVPRRFRTTCSTVPPDAPEDATSLLVKESLRSYMSSWHAIQYKYSAYSGSYRDLPGGTPPDVLPEQVFEVDTEDNDEESSQRNGAQQITKQGWLYKGPDNGLETSIMSFTRSFKRRYFYLKRQADMTYMIEFFKDERKLDQKGSIFMDSAVSVVKSSRRGKHAFELQMQNKSFYLFAAEAEAEMESWVTTLKKVIQTNDSSSTPSLDRLREKECDSSPAKSVNLQESLEHSMNPVLQKYARETDNILALKRREGRQKLFSIYPQIQRGIQSPGGSTGDDIDMYEEQFGTRFIVECCEFQLRLQANLAEEGKPRLLNNPEPFFITLALYDAREGKKISEDFHFDPNGEKVRAMIPSELVTATDMLNNVNGDGGKEPHLYGVDTKWLAYCDRAIFNVVRPHHEIFLVARIEKVLQGSINAAVDPYMRNPDEKLATKVHRQMVLYCNKLGHYRMPFAWGVRPIFLQKTSGELDTNAGFALFKTERAKLNEDEIIKHLQDIKKPEKQGKWQPILGSLMVRLKPFKDKLQNTLTSSLVPLSPFPAPPSGRPTLEVEEFALDRAELASPFTTYLNQLYVYPRHLKYDNQKAFTKARNIACYIEIRDSDTEGTVPLKCIRGHQGSSLYTTSVTTAVIHHDSNPEFIEEVKACLPTQLHDRHHLVFTFSHVSCDLSKTTPGKTSTKKALSLDSVVGYAWMPLLTNGRVNVGDQAIRVSSNLPPGYLQHEQLGLGKGYAGPDIRWVDGGRPLFKFNLRLVSTIYTKDQHLHNFFAHCHKMSVRPTLATDFETSNKLKHDPPMTSPAISHLLANEAYNREMLKYVKSLHAVDVSTLINFLPTLLNQLFRLLPVTQSEDVATNAIRVLIHVVSEVDAAGKPKSLQTYVKYVFATPPVLDAKRRTVHEELVRHLETILVPKPADLLVAIKFLRQAAFFFKVTLKAMAQFLLNTGRIKMVRNERFPASFQRHVQTLVQTIGAHIVQKFRDYTTETRTANISLADFIKQCFSLMDRGFVFRLINMYIDNFNPADPRILHEYKFEFLRIVCNHEFYIPLCLPIMTRKVKNYKDLKHDYTLSTEFRRNHFLVGLLLQEVKMSLNEGRDIRACAIGTLRNLLAKHAFDDRYQTKPHQARICTLYLPFITVILENKNRLIHNDDSQITTPSGTLTNGDASPPDGSMKHGGMATNSSSASFEAQSGSGMSPHHARLMVRDPGVLAIIAGQVPAPTLAGVGLDNSKTSDHGSSSSLGSTASHSSTNVDKDSREHTHRRSHSVQETGGSMANASYIACYDQLDHHEVKDMLVCFTYIVSNLSEEILLGWFNNSSECDVINFFDILETCLKYFRYAGRRRIASLCIISDTKRALTLPVKMNQQQLRGHGRCSSSAFSETYSEAILAGLQGEFNESDMQANLSTEVAMVVLDVVCLYTSTFKSQLKFQNGDNPIMQRVFDLHLHFLQTNQSEMVLRHSFAALRSFISKFPTVLFVGEATMCGRLCYEILRCCNLRLTSTRREACALMYLLMRSNFEFSKRKNFTRVHLQMIISVSQLISAVVGLSNSRFSESLSLINSYANNDKAIQKTSFSMEVKDLTKRIRTVLMATAAMKEHQNDPEMLIDLQYSLAKSYASTPELRKTWLESMARIHVNNRNFSEAAHCYLHIAALVAEYLRRRGDFPQGCAAFASLSPNVKREESAMQDDCGMQDIPYTKIPAEGSGSSHRQPMRDQDLYKQIETSHSFRQTRSKDHLTELLEQCADLMEKAERYELLGRLYRLIIPIYEYNRHFQKLAHAYEVLHLAYSKVVEVMHSGRRLLGMYFRVKFFGPAFEEDDGKEYIYKEPKVTGLTEICERLRDLYTLKFGRGTVQLIMDSAQVNLDDLDQKFAYIQVTHVTQYFDAAELEQRKTDFERNNNLKLFMYETPFTRDGRARGQIDEQYKRRVILTTDHSFPYIKKRLLVYYRKQEELTPIEVAIDEMKNKVSELHQVVMHPHCDLKRLQLKLQGSISVQVNAGPVAYADVFLEAANARKFRADKVTALKDIFREFVSVCKTALDMNGRLIDSDQLEYQESLRMNFRDMVERLGEIFGEPLLDPDEDAMSMSGHRGSVTVFNVISATNSTSTI